MLFDFEYKVNGVVYHVDAEGTSEGIDYVVYDCNGNDVSDTATESRADKRGYLSTSNPA